MLNPSSEVNILNTFRVMTICILLLLLTNLLLKLLSTQATGSDKLLSTQRVKTLFSDGKTLFSDLVTSKMTYFRDISIDIMHSGMLFHKKIQCNFVF